MKIQLIEGEFNSNDALELITQMMQVKIKFHENKISNTEIEEDIKARETKIISLQRNLFELRNSMNASAKGVELNAIISIE